MILKVGKDDLGVAIHSLTAPEKRRFIRSDGSLRIDLDEEGWRTESHCRGTRTIYIDSNNECRLTVVHPVGNKGRIQVLIGKVIGM